MKAVAQTIKMVMAGINLRGGKASMSEQPTNNLDLVRHLSKERHTGLLVCYKALKGFEFDYEKALDYLKSDESKNSIHSSFR